MDNPIDTLTFYIPQDKLEYYASIPKYRLMQELITNDTVNAIAQWDAYLLYHEFFPNIKTPDYPCPDYIKLLMRQQEYRDRPRKLYDRMMGLDFDGRRQREYDEIIAKLALKAYASDEETECGRG